MNAKDFSFSLVPQEVTVTCSAELTFTLVNSSSHPITLHNDEQIQELSASDQSVLPEDVDCFYLYFSYGSGASDLMEENGEKITGTCYSVDWNLKSYQDSKLKQVWVLYPKSTITWAPGSSGQVKVIFQVPQCNRVPGTTPFYLKPPQGELCSLDITKYPYPSIIDLKISSQGPYYIGEEGTITWTVPDAKCFQFVFDGQPVQPDSDIYTITIPHIRYGTYTLEVYNQIKTKNAKDISFPLEFLRSFQIQSISPQQVTFSWDTEPKNICVDTLKILDQSAPEEPLACLSRATGNETVSLSITTDHTFLLQAEIQGTEGQQVQQSIPYHVPVIESFSLADTDHHSDWNINCQQRLLRAGAVDFLPPKLVVGHAASADTVPFYVSCKGGSTTYAHTYRWSGKYIDHYMLETMYHEKYGSFPGDSNGAEIYTTSTTSQATLYGADQYGYVVSRHTSQKEERT